MFRILHALYEMPPVFQRLGRLRGWGDHHFYHHRLGSEQAIINVHAGGSIAHNLGHPGIGQEIQEESPIKMAVLKPRQTMKTWWENMRSKSRVGVLRKKNLALSETLHAEAQHWRCQSLLHRKNGNAPPGCSMECRALCSPGNGMFFSGLPSRTESMLSCYPH